MPLYCCFSFRFGCRRRFLSGFGQSDSLLFAADMPADFFA